MLSLFLMSGVAFADTPKDGDPQPAQTAKGKKSAKKPAKSATAILTEQVEALRQSMEAQQQQIRQLQDELAKRDVQIGDAKSAAAAADAKASEADAKASAAASSTAEVKTTTTTLNSDVSDLKLSNEAVKGAVQDTQKKIIAAESPSTIRYKGVTITPGGFLAAETVTRTRATSGDINTPFTGDPFNAADLSHTTESNFTARQSRLSLLVEGKLATAKDRRLLRSRLPERRHHFQQPSEQQLYLAHTASVCAGNMGKRIPVDRRPDVDSGDGKPERH